MPPKHWLTFNGLHIIISQKTDIFMGSVGRTSNLESYSRVSERIQAYFDSMLHHDLNRKCFVNFVYFHF
jgi:hypothetical protein